MTARNTVAMRRMPKAVVALAVLLIGAGLAQGLAREALAYSFYTNTDLRAQNFPRDSDGLVPERESNLNLAGYGGNWTVYGQTSWYRETVNGRTTTTDTIFYDWRATDYCRVPRYKVADHEKAHSRGWEHGFGSPYLGGGTYNAAYYAEVQKCIP